MFHRIAICEDEEIMLEQLDSYLKECSLSENLNIEIQKYRSAEELLENLEIDTEIIMLDIKMGNMNGMECARVLRKNGYTGYILFITSMTDYAIEGYDVQAYAFIPKPADKEAVQKRVLSCLKELEKNQKSILPIKTAEGEEFLKIQDILYADVFQHEITFFMKDRSAKAPYQLSRLEKQLEPYGFFRCHRSCLVNMNEIQKINQNSLILSNGTEVPLSRHRRKAFMEAFAAYSRENFL